MQTGYAVIIQYWNGSTYSVDFDAIVVYPTRAEAEAEKKEITAFDKAGDVMVDIAEVEIK
jgi:hypothetical protein